MWYITIKYQRLNSLEYSIIRLVIYNVTTSLIYKKIYPFQCFITEISEHLLLNRRTLP